MKKVLILNSCVNGGGAGRSLENYLRYKDPDLDIHMVVPEMGTMGEVFSKYATLWIVPQFVERIHQSRFRLPSFLDFGWVHILINCFDLVVAMMKITKLGRTIGADVIYCNHMLANPVGAFVGWKLQCPTVYHARNVHVASFGKLFYSWLAKFSFVKKIICNSKASAELFLQVVPEKVVIIYNFLDLSLYNADVVEKKLRSEFQIPQNQFIFGYSGRLLPKKGVPILLEAFAHLTKTHPNIHLAILGDNDGGVHIDWKSEYQKYIQDHAITSKVTFTGFQKDVRPYLIDFDVLVLPSIEHESFGRVLIEAMALNVPCIASALGGTVEIIEEGKTGFLVQPGQVDALYEKMKRFLEEPALKQQFANTGYQIVHEKFSAEKLSKDISAILKQV